MEEASPEFLWTQQSRPFRDVLGHEAVFESQVKMMQRLFKNMKKTTTLAQWYRNRLPGDLHLYAALGFVNPIEYQMFKKGMQRWQDFLVEEERQLMKQRGEKETVIQVPTQRVHLFLKSLAADEHAFDQHEELLLRFEKPCQLVRAVDDALYLEMERTNRQEGVNVVDKLLCQTEQFETETECWLEMNKMAANNSTSPFKVQLKNTSGALEKLNQFKLYKALADIHDYSLQPLATLRLEDGKLQKNCILLEQTPRIQGALYFLQELGLVDREQLERVQGMSMQQREQEELCLKRGAVSAFVGDIVQTTSDTLWINHTLDAFSFSFQKIIEKIGMPIVATQRVKVQGQDGEDRFMRIVKVLFPQTPNNGEKSPIKYVLPQKDCSK